MKITYHFIIIYFANILRTYHLRVIWPNLANVANLSNNGPIIYYICGCGHNAFCEYKCGPRVACIECSRIQCDIAKVNTASYKFLMPFLMTGALISTAFAKSLLIVLQKTIYHWKIFLMCRQALLCTELCTS